MARKDWAKQETSKDGTMQWFNNSTRQSVFVYKQDFIPELRRKSHWVFEVGTSDGTILEVKAKNKMHAVKKARAYMEKN